jgi:hypothetical protein
MRFSLRLTLVAFGLTSIVAGVGARALLVDPQELRLREAIAAVDGRGRWFDRDSNHVRLVVPQGSLDVAAAAAVLTARRIQTIVFHQGGFPPAGPLEQECRRHFRLQSLINRVAVYERKPVLP